MEKGTPSSPEQGNLPAALAEAKWALESFEKGDWAEVSDNINQCDAKLSRDEDDEVKQEIRVIIATIREKIDAAPDDLKEMIADRIRSIEQKISKY